GLSAYFGYTIYFNKKILPHLQILKGKNAQRKKDEKLSKERIFFIIFVSFGISIGLMASLLYEPLKSTVDDGVVILGIVMASFLGIKYTIHYFKEIKQKDQSKQLKGRYDG
ncbi:MAG: hypothetical protein GX892_16155, partial [Thermoanaerobacteraceae bacterium]|nr:hypothetical protein [Thermoanaerobacteraceae bacterium]